MRGGCSARNRNDPNNKLFEVLTKEDYIFFVLYLTSGQFGRFILISTYIRCYSMMVAVITQKRPNQQI